MSLATAFATTLLTILYTAHLTRGYCSLSFGSATIKNYGSSEAIISSNAAPHSKLRLPFGCSRTQRWLKRRVDQGLTSVPKCISSIRIRCTSASPFVFEACLQQACQIQRANPAGKVENSKPNSVDSKQETSQRSSQNINITVGKARYFIVVAVIISIVTATVWILSARYCKAPKLRTQPVRSGLELPAVGRLDPLAPIGQLNRAGGNGEE